MTTSRGWWDLCMVDHDDQVVVVLSDHGRDYKDEILTEIPFSKVKDLEALVKADAEGKKMQCHLNSDWHVIAWRVSE